jgi:hypothetical protein
VGFIGTQPYVPSHTASSLYVGRFPPRSKIKWTLPQVRRELQQLLLEMIGWCPLCARPFRTQRWTCSKRRREHHHRKENDQVVLASHSAILRV